VYAAQASIDIADEPILYKELAERIEGLQTDLLQERQDNERLRAQIQELQTENGALKAEVDGR
jgi:regulator of replication initiation timing